MDNVLELLDDVEKQIEAHRKRARDLQNEQTQLEGTLKMISSQPDELKLSPLDKEDVLATVSRLERRLEAVSVEVTTVRDEEQQEALASMTYKIDNLVDAIQMREPNAMDTLQRYVNVCSKETFTGAQDHAFEKLLLSCASDDQRTIQKRLENIKSYTDALKKDDDDEEKEEDKAGEAKKMKGDETQDKETNDKAEEEGERKEEAEMDATETPGEEKK